MPRNRRHTAIDIETWGLNAHEDGGSFALGGAFDERGPFRFDTREGMVSWVRSKANRGRVFWAHNGGRYDYLSLFGNYVSRFAKDITRVNGRLIEMRVRSGRNVTRLRDSYNLYPRPLAVLGEALGYPKGETPQKFKAADRTAGLTEQDYEYCLRDCQILWESIMALQKEFGEVRATLPSMALSVFKHRYMGPVGTHFTVPTAMQALDLSSRQAYYGGRVEAYQIGPLNGERHYYDINSLYPQAMLTAILPFPHTLHTAPINAFDSHLRDHSGYAEGEVTVPDTLDPPPLPYRRLGKKLIFPTGTFSGAWPFAELKAAIALGCRFTPTRIVCGKPMPRSPFLAYISDIYAKKSTANGVMREVYKLLLNGLYGKFGEYHRKSSEYAERFDPERLAQLRKANPDADFKPISIHRADGYYEWSAKDGGEASHAIYSWAAAITSEARVINLKVQYALKEAGVKTLYTDTDSFLTNASIITDKPSIASLVGPEIGQLKEEPKAVSEIWGAKAYLTDGGRVLKGVSKRADPIAYSLLSKTPTLYGSWGVRTASSAIRHGKKAGEPVYQVKTGIVSYDKRKLLNGGKTRPWKVENGELV